MLKKRLCLTIFILIVGILSGCSSANVGGNGGGNTASETGKISLLDEETAWEGDWELYDEEGNKYPNEEYPITLSITHNNKNRFEFEFTQGEEELYKGEAYQGRINYYYLSEKDCYLGFEEKDLSISADPSGCPNLSDLETFLDKNEAIFKRVEQQSSNFQQLLFLTPYQDKVLHELVGSDYAELLEGFQNPTKLENEDSFRANVYTNEAQDIVLMYNEYNQIWIAYDKEGIVTYHTNDEWMAGQLPVTISSILPGSETIEYANQENAEKFRDKIFGKFPIMEDEYTLSYLDILSSKGNGAYSLEVYSNYGMGTYYSFGNFIGLLNGRVSKLEAKLTLDKNTDELTVYLVGDDYDPNFSDEMNDAESPSFRAFSGTILEKVKLTSENPTQEISTEVYGTKEVHIILETAYDNKDATVKIDNIKLYE